MVPRGAGSFFHHAGHHEPFEGVVYNPDSSSAKSHTNFYIRPKNASHHNDVVVVNDHSDNERSEDGHFRSKRHRHTRLVTLDEAKELTHALFEAHLQD